MIDLLTFLVEKITGSHYGDDFDINEEDQDGLPAQAGKTVMNVSAKPELVGLIIGREGKTIKNIRKILSVRAVLEKRNVNINVVPRE